ncbi:MAG: MoxR family ATPase [Acidobacteria bacterium]|nr:MoxR family ATPase [Acidobacteriota bacterium]
MGVTESAVRTLEQAVSQVIRGKPEALRLAVSCLLARGHLLIEDVPGVGKTTLAHALARSVGCDFHRLQCTSDMLPSDIVGVTIYNTQTSGFEFVRGPVFTNFLLADEINRATPKTQSALLEAMNEGQVTVDGATYPLKAPFMVIATQNPAEHHGTYPLPESQLDRFLLRITLGYPDRVSERQIVRKQQTDAGVAEPLVLSPEALLEAQEQVTRVAVDDALVDYVLDLVARTRSHEALSLGVSPRGAQGVYRAAQAFALISGRDYVIPDDVKQVMVPVCAHRVMLNTRSTMSQRGPGAAERVIESILTEVAVPL